MFLFSEGVVKGVAARRVIGKGSQRWRSRGGLLAEASVGTIRKRCNGGLSCYGRNTSRWSP